MSTPTDLDEFHTKVRDAFVKRLFGECLIAYRGGALRGAIVTLWTAVVFDIVSKLRELELAGDMQAAEKLREFETARQRNDVESALAFERRILALARDSFELLTHQEHDDLARLQADRNRCAHPSMNSHDEPYTPSSELVRYHLYSGAQHLFIRPPVQGKAALDRLFGEVKSQYFPRDVAQAARILAGGPLGRAKPSLIRNFLVASLKAALTSPDASDHRTTTPIFVAIAAVKSLHPAATSTVFADSLPRLSQQVASDQMGRLMRLAWAVSEVLDYVPDDVVGRMEEFLRDLPDGDLTAILVGLRHPALQTVANEALNNLEWDQLSRLVSRQPARAARYPEVVEYAVDMYCNSRSWDMSNDLGPRVIAPMASAFDWPTIERILRAVAENTELSHAFSTKEVLVRLRDAAGTNASAFDELGNALELGRRFPDLFPETAPEPPSWSSDDDDDLPF